MDSYERILGELEKMADQPSQHPSTPDFDDDFVEEDEMEEDNFAEALAIAVRMTGEDVPDEEFRQTVMANFMLIANDRGYSPEHVAAFVKYLKS